MNRANPKCATQRKGRGAHPAGYLAKADCQRGVALVIVLWFVAAMSLLVTGILAQSRTDVRMTQLHLAKARATAAADGAIMLAAAEMFASGGRGGLDGRLIEGVFTIGELPVHVTTLRTDGLININAASPEILVRLFTVLGAVDPAVAQQIADNIVRQRQRMAPTLDGRPPGRFEAIEDLLLVDGVSRPLFDRVRDAVCAGPDSQRSINWHQAPVSVLTVLADGDMRLVTGALAQRASTQVGPPPPGLTGAEAPARGTSEFRIDAIVEDNGRRLLRRRWLNTTARSRSALPWRFERTEAARATSETALAGIGY